MIERLGPFWMGVGVVTAVASAACAALALQAIATPKDFDARRLALESQTRRMEALARTPGNDAAYPKGAVCEGLDGEATVKLREALEQAAAAQALRRVQISLGEGSASGAKLAPVPLRLEVEGGYPAVLNWLDQARQLTPTIFVDTLDVMAAGPDARLTMTGRVFCWTHA